ncbi:MAG: hypothetical protein RI567_00220 [Marinobacter sp.]|nr:hypothetical protein [Marinobacter sp.]
MSFSSGTQEENQTNRETDGCRLYKGKPIRCLTKHEKIDWQRHQKAEQYQQEPENLNHGQQVEQCHSQERSEVMDHFGKNNSKGENLHKRLQFLLVYVFKAGLMRCVSKPYLRLI